MQGAIGKFSLMRSHSRGVTLIELLVAISVLGILLAIGVPAMARFLHDVRVSNATNEFVNAIGLARAEAIKRSRLVTLCRSTDAETATTPSCSTVGDDWNTGWLVFVEGSSSSGVGEYDDGEVILARRGSLPGNISATMSTANAWITFNSSGEPGGMSNFGINFNYSADTSIKSRQICMSRSGRVRVELDATTCSY